MNARQLQYAVLLSQIRNFSQVAEKLKITQPALSKQIRLLEEEVGVRLFDRSTTPLTLTPAGEDFIRQAQSLLRQEDQLLRSMERYRSGQAGRLVIGVTPFRSTYLLPDVVAKVRQRYPGIQIRLQEAGIDILRQEAAEGKYDFAIVNLPADASVLEITPLEPDRLVLAVPNHMVPMLEDTAAGQVHIRQCGDLPFVAVSPQQELRHLFDKLCAAADFYPNIAVEVVGLTTARAMVRSGVAAAILPKQFMAEDGKEYAVTLFDLAGQLDVRQPVIVRRRDQYLSDAARYAMDLLIKG